MTIREHYYFPSWIFYSTRSLASKYTAPSTLVEFPSQSTVRQTSGLNPPLLALNPSTLFVSSSNRLLNSPSLSFLFSRF